MEQYREQLRSLSRQTAHCAAIDGFPSEELRRSILNEVVNVILDAEPRGEPPRFMTLNATEQARAEYFRRAQEAGSAAAGARAAGLIRKNAPEYLRKLILAGAEAIGGKIGRGYAAEIYPELRRLQVAGIPVKNPALKTPVQAINYTFTVVNYGNCLELSAVEATGEKPGSEIFHDGLNERYIEKFVFATVEEADDALGAWERHNRDSRCPPPVRYGIVIEQEEIGSVIHIPPWEDGGVRILENGERLETRVFATLKEAEKNREEKRNRKHDNQVAPPENKMPGRKPEPVCPIVPEPPKRKKKKHFFIEK